MKTVMVSRVVEVPVQEGVKILRDKLQEYANNQKLPEFRRGDIVLVQNSWLGIVADDTDTENTTAVFWIGEDGEVGGPSYGWELKHLKVLP